MVNIIGFMGKGGVGKTTLSVAAAEAMQQRGVPSCNVMVDLQQNGQYLHDQYNLACTVVAADVRQAYEDITWLLEESPLTGVAADAPEAVETVALMVEICRILPELAAEYDFISVDFPPNHALSILALPEYLNRRIVKAITLRQRIHKLLTGHDEYLETLKKVKEMVEGGRDVFNQMKGWPIALAEPLGMLECQRTISELQRHKFDHLAPIVNKHMPSSHGCDICSSRWKAECLIIAEMANQYDHIHSVEYSLDFDQIVAAMDQHLRGEGYD